MVERERESYGHSQVKIQKRERVTHVESETDRQGQIYRNSEKPTERERQRKMKDTNRKTQRKTETR